MFQKFFNYVIIILFSFIVITSCNLENDYIKSEEGLPSSNASPEKCYIPQDPLQTIDLVLNGIEKERIGHILWYLAYNIEWTFEGDTSEIPFAGTYYGKWGVQYGLRKFFSRLNIKNLELTNQVEGEENIISYTRIEGFIPRTRKTFDMEVIFIWEFNERNRIDKCSVSYNEFSVGFAFSSARGEGHIISDTTTSPQAQFFYNYYMQKIKEWMRTATYQELRAAQKPLFPSWPADANVEQVTIAGLEGDIVRVHPDTVNDRIIVYLHGGGFFRGDKDLSLMFNYQLSKNTKIPVLAVNYPLAPENPYTIPLESCLAVYQELLNEYEPENIALIGESSGGNLVLATALLAKARNIPLPGALIPMSPWLNLTNSGGTYETHQEIEAMLSIEFLNDKANLYLNGTSPTDPIASPIFTDINGYFPPVFFTVSSYEILLGDSMQMFNKLVSSKIDVTIEILDGLVHAWPVAVSLVPEADRSTLRISNFIKDKLNLNN